MPRPSGERAAAILSLAAFALVVVVEHLLQPDLSPGRHVISEYANGEAGGAMTAGFAAWCLSWVLLARLVWARRLQICAVGTAVAAAGAALITIFPTQAVEGELPRGVPYSTAGRLHDLGGELLLVGALAAAAALSIRGDVPRRVRVAAGALALVALFGAAALIAVGDPAPGVRQRLLVAAVVAWQGLLLATCPARRRRRRDRRAGVRDEQSSASAVAWKAPPELSDAADT